MGFTAVTCPPYSDDDCRPEAGCAPRDRGGDHGGRLDLIEDLFTDREATRARAWITPFRQAFPDVRMEIVELVSEGEVVAGRFRCSATHLGEWGDRGPTGRRFEGVDEVYFFTVTNGRVARMWGIEDTLERKRQLGLD